MVDVMEYDVFISHASEDKDEVARPLAQRLEQLGLRVWLDECQLTVGDSLRRSIDRGLGESRFGVVVLSPAFFRKEWPNKELDGLVARDEGQEKVILPVWYQVTATEIRRFSPILADRLAVSTERGIDEVARSILEAVNTSSQQLKSVHTSAAEHESELIKRLRTQMLTAPTSRELRHSFYELEEHLALYPNSPQARMFKDELVSAMERAEWMEPSREIKLPMALPAPMRGVGCLAYVVAVVVIAVIVYILFSIFG